MKSLLSVHKLPKFFFGIFSFLCAFIIPTALVSENTLLLALPIVVLVIIQTILNYKPLYYLLLAMIPLSTEVHFSNTLSTDFPTEPLIVGLFGVSVIIFIKNWNAIESFFKFHPISIALAIHFLWTIVTTLFSDQFVFSFKFALAKLWYINVFYLLTHYLIKSEKEVKKVLWLIFIPLTLATFKVILHHASLNFGFKEINIATSPFFRNHVSYAAILTLFLPLGIFLFKHSKGLIRLIALSSFLLLLFGIATAYTRAAYACIVIMIGVYIVVRLNIMRTVLLLTTIGIITILSYLSYNKNYLKFIPSDQTVAHTSLNDIVSSTSKLKDVSTMERYYRWIAGAQMIQEQPYLGFGPGNFYTFYKQYALNKFSTYVSNNPERSGIHNYYLMLCVEQGILGCLFFIVIVFLSFIEGTRIYHESQTPFRRDLCMAFMLCLAVIYGFLFMNDMIETDKIGSFFFLSLAFLILLDKQNKTAIEN